MQENVDAPEFCQGFFGNLFRGGRLAQISYEPQNMVIC
jgi:hypothetical protein